MSIISVVYYYIVIYGRGKSMNKLSTYQRTQVIKALVEGNSIRATCRLTGVAKGTVLKLLCDIGKACYNYQNQTLRDLKLSHIQHVWSVKEIIALLDDKNFSGPN